MLFDTIKAVLGEHGLQALRSNDHEYCSWIWDNVITYMLASRYGIAVLEDYRRKEPSDRQCTNPNVTQEFGFMEALGRKVLVLRDKGLVQSKADMIGRISHPFDSSDYTTLRNMIREEIERWIDGMK